MSELKKKIMISALTAILFFPIVLVGINVLWNIGLFDFGTGISSMSFFEAIVQLYAIILDPVLIVFLCFYFYRYWYLKVKRHGAGYLINYAQKIRIEILIVYAAVLAVGFAHQLFPMFAALFVPVILSIFLPITVFILLLAEFLSKEKSMSASF